MTGEQMSSSEEATASAGLPRPDPPELDGGQDGTPDLLQLLKVLRRELAELVDLEPGEPISSARLVRLGALLAVIRRLLGEH